MTVAMTTDICHAELAEQLDTAPASPLLTGDTWLEANGRPCILRIDLPISASEMVAALYGEQSRLQRGDLDSVEGVWAHTAIVVVQDGLFHVERLADKIHEQQQPGTLEASEWLAYCRQRVAAVAEQLWQTRKHRCPCGYATDDMNAFDTHLGATEGMQPEHFEVLGGWSLEQVLAWESAMAARA